MTRHGPLHPLNQRMVLGENDLRRRRSARWSGIELATGNGHTVVIDKRATLQPVCATENHGHADLGEFSSQVRRAR